LAADLPQLPRPAVIRMLQDVVNLHPDDDVTRRFVELTTELLPPDLGAEVLQPPVP